MKTIPLTQGKFAIVDDEDYDGLSTFHWRATKTKSGGYAARRGRDPVVYMHRQIMDAPKGMYVDHINHVQHDNRKVNLRVCTNSQNMQNGLKHKNGSSRYKGVYWYKPSKKWRAMIRVHGKGIHIGYFIDEVNAAKAYDEKAMQLFGEFAQLNIAV